MPGASAGMPAKLQVRRPNAVGPGRARDRGSEREIVGAADPVYAAAFQALPVAALILDAGGVGYPILHANESFCRLTGYHPQELVGRPWTILLRSGGSSGGPESVGAALKAGRGVEVSVEASRKDASRFLGALSIGPVRHPAGDIRWFLLSCAETAAPPRAPEASKEEIAQRTRPLEEALERTRDLLHEVDHRVKNSLQVISSLMLLKARRTADPAVQRALHAMTERLGALATMHRLLSAGGDPSRFDLKSFTQDFVDELSSGLVDERI